MAFEGLQRAWSDDLILHRDARLCVVDKPAGSPPGPADEAWREVGDEIWPTPLTERVASHGLGRTWVLFAPPARGSGATLLSFEAPGPSRSGDALPAPIQAVSVVVGVDGWRLGASGVLPLPGGARLKYRVARRKDARALVELECAAPLQAVLGALRREQLWVVGDEAPQAPAATRLLLHVRRLHGLPGADAQLPPDFDAWLAGAAQTSPARFAAALARAALARHGLWRELDAFRLLGEDAGEIAGLSVERYGDHAVLYVSSEEAAACEAALADCLMDHGALGVYVKRRVRADLRGVDPSTLAPSLPSRGAPAPESFATRNAGVASYVRLGDGLGTGLFLDQRANWARLARRARGAALLNLFCYTGPFTVSAAAAGAAATTSVDLSGRALTRLAENLELNQLSGPQHRLLKADVPAWLARAARAAQRYDVVVIDPPSFGTRSRGVLSTRRDNPRLLSAVAALLAPGGALLCVSHHRKISAPELGAQALAACRAAGLGARVRQLPGGWDCPTLPGVTPIKSVLATLE